MERLAELTRNRYVKMGAYAVGVYLLLLILAAIRMPGAASSYSLNGLLAVLVSVGVIAWSAAKRCSSHLTMATVFLILIGSCAQCVIAKTSTYKQAALFVAATVCGAVVVTFWGRFEAWIVKSPPLIVLGIIAGASTMLILLLLIFGKDKNGARAWLEIGPLSMQLTEPVKLLAVFFFAFLFSRRDISEPKKVLIGAAFYVLNAALLASVNELGTLLVITFVFCVMCFLFLKSSKYIALTLGSFAFIFVVGYIVLHVLSGIAQNAINVGEEPGSLASLCLKITAKLGQRFQLWLHRDTLDANGLAYQSLKARDAIIVGGVFGSAYNVHIPYSGSDFIFPSIILRFGLAMGLTVFILFFVVYFYGTQSYLALKPSLAQTMCAGCVHCVTIQALLMIFGSTNFFIMTGIPIPFISAGGTAQMVTLIMTALMLFFSSGMEDNYE